MDKISLAMGSGGLETSRLLEKLVLSRVPSWLKTVENGLGIDFPDDSAAFPLPDGGYLVTTVDSYTVKPIFFPGGNIGSLAAAGTINDVLMLGGKPFAVLDAVVVEEGLEYEMLEKVFDSLVDVLKAEGVKLVGGDLKVMPRGEVDKIVLTTVGLGYAKQIIVDKNIRPGDRIIVSGPIGEHGACILASQNGLESNEFRSDVKPLTKLMIPLIEKFGGQITAARDPTRGGLAMVLNDWAKASETTIVVDETTIPVREPVATLCEMLGIDVLSLASEGAAVLAVKPEFAEDVVETMRASGFKDAAVIGHVQQSQHNLNIAVAKTSVGGYRVIEPPTGEIVPRIC